MAKKVNPEDRAKQIISKVNQVKRQLVNFDQKTLEKELKKLDCPYSNIIFSILKNKAYIIKDGKYWNFTTTVPIHYAVIRASIDKKVLNNANSYANFMSRSKKSAPVEEKGIVEEVIAIAEESMEPSESQMIALLKARGYKIYKPTKYTEV